MGAAQRILDWYGHVPAALPPGEARLHVGAKAGYSAWALVQTAYAAIFLTLDLPGLALFYAALAVLTLIYLLLLVRGRGDVAFVLGNLHNLTALTVTTVHTGLGTGFFLFALVGLLYATLAEWVPRGLQWAVSAASAFTFVAVILFGLLSDPLVYLPLPWVLALGALNGAGTAGFLLMVGLTYRVFVDRAEAALEAEYQKSEALLHNIMPPAVAERLKRNPEVIADRHADVSILFADIVGFTDMASRSSPEALVTLLNRVFSRFDALVDDRDLEKIKTIGDAYMVVAGLPAPRADHAAAIADLALAMTEASEDVARQTGELLRIRIGIHSGTVVAGVIGQKKFAYDIWGDTVNVAARMESHGEPGRIQLSADTAALLGDAFEIEPRGSIEIKGKGAMPAYFLNGRRSTA